MINNEVQNHFDLFFTETKEITKRASKSNMSDVVNMIHQFSNMLLNPSNNLNKKTILQCQKLNEFILAQLPNLEIDDNLARDITKNIFIIAAMIGDVPSSSNYNILITQLFLQHSNLSKQHDVESALSSFLIFQSFVKSFFFSEKIENFILHIFGNSEFERIISVFTKLFLRIAIIPTSVPSSLNLIRPFLQILSSETISNKTGESAITFLSIYIYKFSKSDPSLINSFKLSHGLQCIFSFLNKIESPILGDAFKFLLKASDSIGVPNISTIDFLKPFLHQNEKYWYHKYLYEALIGTIIEEPNFSFDRMNKALSYFDIFKVPFRNDQEIYNILISLFSEHVKKMFPQQLQVLLSLLPPEIESPNYERLSPIIATMISQKSFEPFPKEIPDFFQALSVPTLFSILGKYRSFLDLFKKSFKFDEKNHIVIMTTLLDNVDLFENQEEYVEIMSSFIVIDHTYKKMKILFQNLLLNFRPLVFKALIEALRSDFDVVLAFLDMKGFERLEILFNLGFSVKQRSYIHSNGLKKRNPNCINHFSSNNIGKLIINSNNNNISANQNNIKNQTPNIIKGRNDTIFNNDNNNNNSNAINENSKLILDDDLITNFLIAISSYPDFNAPLNITISAMGLEHRFFNLDKKCYERLINCKNRVEPIRLPIFLPFVKYPPILRSQNDIVLASQFSLPIYQKLNKIVPNILPIANRYISLDYALDLLNNEKDLNIDDLVDPNYDSFPLIELMSNRIDSAVCFSQRFNGITFWFKYISENHNSFVLFSTHEIQFSLTGNCLSIINGKQTETCQLLPNKWHFVFIGANPWIFDQDLYRARVDDKTFNLNLQRESFDYFILGLKGQPSIAPFFFSTNIRIFPIIFNFTDIETEYEQGPRLPSSFNNKQSIIADNYVLQNGAKIVSFHGFASYFKYEQFLSLFFSKFSERKGKNISQLLGCLFSALKIHNFKIHNLWIYLFSTVKRNFSIFGRNELSQILNFIFCEVPKNMVEQIITSFIANVELWYLVPIDIAHFLLDQTFEQNLSFLKNLFPFFLSIFNTTVLSSIKIEIISFLVSTAINLSLTSELKFLVITIVYLDVYNDLKNYLIQLLIQFITDKRLFVYDTIPPNLTYLFVPENPQFNINIFRLLRLVPKLYSSLVPWLNIFVNSLEYWHCLFSLLVDRDMMSSNAELALTYIDAPIVNDFIIPDILALVLYAMTTIVYTKDPPIFLEKATRQAILILNSMMSKQPNFFTSPESVNNMVKLVPFLVNLPNLIKITQFDQTVKLEKEELANIDFSFSNLYQNDLIYDYVEYTKTEVHSFSTIAFSFTDKELKNEILPKDLMQYGYASFVCAFLSANAQSLHFPALIPVLFTFSPFVTNELVAVLVSSFLKKPPELSTSNISAFLSFLKMSFDFSAKENTKNVVNFIHSLLPMKSQENEKLVQLIFIEILTKQDIYDPFDIIFYDNDINNDFDFSMFMFENFNKSLIKKSTSMRSYFDKVLQLPLIKNAITADAQRSLISYIEGETIIFPKALSGHKIPKIKSKFLKSLSRDEYILSLFKFEEEFIHNQLYTDFKIRTASFTYNQMVHYLLSLNLRKEESVLSMLYISELNAFFMNPKNADHNNFKINNSSIKVSKSKIYKHNASFSFPMNSARIDLYSHFKGMKNYTFQKKDFMKFCNFKKVVNCQLKYPPPIFSFGDFSSLSLTSVSDVKVKYQLFINLYGNKYGNLLYSFSTNVDETCSTLFIYENAILCLFGSEVNHQQKELTLNQFSDCIVSNSNHNNTFDLNNEIFCSILDSSEVDQNIFKLIKKLFLNEHYDFTLFESHPVLIVKNNELIKASKYKYIIKLFTLKSAPISFEYERPLHPEIANLLRVIDTNSSYFNTATSTSGIGTSISDSINLWQNHFISTLNLVSHFNLHYNTSKDIFNCPNSPREGADFVKYQHEIEEREVSRWFSQTFNKNIGDKKKLKMVSRVCSHNAGSLIERSHLSISLKKKEFSLFLADLTDFDRIKFCQNGTFCVIDFVFGKAQVYRILYERNEAFKLMLMSEYLTSLYSKSVINGVDLVCASTYKENYVLIWDFIRGYSIESIKFDGKILDLLFDEVYGYLWCWTKWKIFLCTVNGAVNCTTSETADDATNGSIVAEIEHSFDIESGSFALDQKLIIETNFSERIIISYDCESKKLQIVQHLK